jgi:hypothetical protein
LPQRHQDTKIIELFVIRGFLMNLGSLMRKLRYPIYIHIPRLPSGRSLGLCALAAE